MKKQTQKIMKKTPEKTPNKKAVSSIQKKTVKATAKKEGKTVAEKTGAVKKAVKMEEKKVSPATKTAKPAEKKGSTPSRHESEYPIRKLKLSKADKKYFRELLMHARASFGEQIQVHVDEALSTRKDSAGERAGMATHMADLGSDNFRHDFELGLLTDEVDVLEMIDEALQRIEDSEYGVCLDCGAVIPRERLEAKPYARYCTKCKSKREEMEDSRYHR